MDPSELMTKARYEDDLEEALEGAIIVAGAAGVGGEAAGGSRPGFVVVSGKSLAEHMPRLRAIAKELANGEDVPLQYVQAHI